MGQLAKADCEEFIKLFDKYVPSCISLILEGVMDGRQVEKLRTIVPLSNLNLVSDANADYFYVHVILCNRNFILFPRFQEIVVVTYLLCSPIVGHPVVLHAGLPAARL